MEAFCRKHRLFRHDWQVATNTLRATFARWPDRLIAGILLLAALAGVRAWSADHSWTLAAWAAVAASLVVGIAAGRFVMARLAFHGFDGLLAADALRRPVRRHYLAGWHGIGVLVLSAVTVTVRPSLLILSMAAYLVGTSLAELTNGFSMPQRIIGSTRPAWSIRVWLRRPATGVAAGVILLLSLLPTRTLGTNVVVAFAGVGTALFVLALTIVDEGTVRFMTIAGYGSGRIVLRLSRALASFVVVAVPGCWLIFGPAPTVIVLATSTAMLLLVAMRVLAYRLHGKRFADFLVVVLAGLLMMVGYAIPVALPVVAVAVFWPLRRRAAAKTWLLA